jgi:protein TonB
MRNDLIIGILVSILLHGGAFYGEKIFSGKKEVRKEVKKEERGEVLVMPKLEEEPEIVEETTTETTAAVAEFAPPMQTDVPSIVTDTSFVQAIQPPPPEGLKPNPGVLTIPANRGIPGGTKLTNVFNLADLDQQPQAKYQAKPVYPFEMRRAGVTGEVVVGFIVNVNGDVQDAYAQKSTQREFEAAAIAAVMKWKFRPGKKGGKAVNTRMMVPIVFSISDE